LFAFDVVKWIELTVDYIAMSRGMHQQIGS
jgi:hypothetical protein